MRKANSMDAGWDLVAQHDAVVKFGEITNVSTGVMGDIPAGHYGKIEGRSGLASKQGIFVLGGVIDAGYEGELKVTLSRAIGSDSDTGYEIKKGDRIAQLVVSPLSSYTPNESNTREEQGFGSSGR